MPYRDGAAPFYWWTSPDGLVDVGTPLGIGESIPIVESAVAQDVNTVRVAYSMDVKHSNPSDPDDALNPANYAFTSGTGHSLTAASVALVQADPTIVDIDISEPEMTGGATYRVTVSNIELNLNYADFTGIGVKPQVSSAAAVDASTVEVTFDSDMDDTGLTTPGNYIFAGPVLITASVVTKIGPTHVHVTITGEMRTGTANYTVTVSNVRDTYYNTIDPAHDDAIFDGLGVAPEVSGAEATSWDIVNVQFSEELADNGAAENPLAYNITGASVVVIGGATFGVGNDNVNLEVSEMLAGGEYTVHVAPGSPPIQIKDLVGNPLDPAHAEAVFEALGVRPRVTTASGTVSYVDVNFDEDMAGAELEDAANYAITGPTAITSVTATIQSATRVRVAIAGEFCTGTGNYTIHVSNVKDDVGNLIDPAHDTAAFNGVGVAPRVSSALVATLALITVDFDESLKDTSALRTPGNYVFSGSTTLTAVSAIPVLGSADKVWVEIVGSMLVGTANYTVTVNSAITDMAGNGIDPAHNSATFDGVTHLVPTAALTHYPVDGTVDVPPREPIRVNALNLYTPVALVESTWNIQLAYTDGTTLRTLDFLTNGVPNANMFTYDKLGDVADMVRGVTYRFLPRAGLWSAGATYTVSSMIANAVGATTMLVTDVEFAESVCFEDNVPAQTAMDAKILTALLSYPSCNYIRKLLLSICSGSANKTVQARTVMWHSMTTDLVAVAAMVFDPALVRNITLCDRTPVLAVHAALQECWPTLLLAYEEIRKVVGNSFGATIENYLKSNSSVYVVNAAACIVVLAAQSQAQVS